MDLDLDTLAALAEQAPGEPLSARTMALPATVAFYRAMREAAPALIAAAREREALAALVEGKARMNAAQQGAYADLREHHIRAVNRLAALARAVRAQASATGTPVSADVARLLEEVRDGAE